MAISVLALSSLTLVMGAEQSGACSRSPLWSAVLGRVKGAAAQRAAQPPLDAPEHGGTMRGREQAHRGPGWPPLSGAMAIKQPERRAII